MRSKRIIALILAAAALFSLCGCSYIERIKKMREPDPDRIITYYNEDYHFYLTYPAYFSDMTVTEAEDNNDEISIKISASDEDFITVDINYKNEDKKSTASLYNYIIDHEFDKKKIIPLSENSFAYDERESDGGTYSIYAATKRMIYKVSYKTDPKNEKAKYVTDSLSFEFDIYANIPKENAYLSDDLVFASGSASARIPADAEYFFDVEPTVDEDGVIHREMCRKLTVYADRYKAVFSSYLTSRYPLLEFPGADVDFTEILNDLGADLDNVIFEGECEFKRDQTNLYKIIKFTCIYNGREAYGSVACGFSNYIRYYEYVDLIAADSSEPMIKNYFDMTASVKL